MDNKNLISVIIPVYNCERYLAEAIESVLGQTYRPVEVIIIDDGSTDRTAEVALRYEPQITYFFQPNAGSSAARNQGVRMSNGSYLAFHDADDIWVINKLALQMQVFHDDPQVDAVFGHVKQFYSPDLDEETRKRIICQENLMPGYLSTTMLIKREAFLRVGFFQTQWEIGEEMNWIIRAREVGLNMVLLPDLLFYRRLHAKNKGLLLKDKQHQRLHILKAALDRRRKKEIGQDQGETRKHEDSETHSSVDQS